MPVIAGFAIALSTVLTAQPVATTSTTTAPVVLPASQAAEKPVERPIEKYVREYFADAPIMVDIARCESRFRQIDQDGAVLKNPHSSAVGVFQIMASIHAASARENLGINIYTLQGNAAYARYLYDSQGTDPWNDSKPCWSKSATYKNMVAASKVAVNK